MLTDLEGRFDGNTKMVENFSTPLSIMERTSRQKNQ
jgi:hypothetical protein